MFIKIALVSSVFACV